METSKSGWLRVLKTGDKEEKLWCVLENGVLWLHRRPGELQGREAVPLHDAVVGDCEPPAPLRMAVRCRRSGAVVVLISLSKEDYTSWMAVLTAAAREFREKRRASVLNRHLMALDSENNILTSKEDEENLNAIKFAPRRRSEFPVRPTVLPVNESGVPGGDPKRQTLRDIVLKVSGSAQLRWAKLSVVIESGLLSLLGEEQVALEELKFAALVEEFRFNAELAVLARLATRAVSWRDSHLPAFHRRSIVASINKLKRCSDAILKLAETHWSQRVTLQTSVFSLLGTEARAAGWCEAYTEYCSHLAELRELLGRAARERAEVVVASFSAQYNMELALVPVQHLTSLRQLMQTLFELLPHSAQEHPAARATRDFLNEILDSCYQELTEQSGSEYVAQMDNELQFDLSCVTPVVPGGPQLLYQRRNNNASSAKSKHDISDISEEEDKKRVARASKSKSRNSIFNGTAFKSAAQFIRRRTAEGLGLRSSRTASLPNILLECPPEIDTPNESESEEEEVSPPPVTPSQNETVPRFFCLEPLYQEYCAFVAQEVAERTMNDGDEKDDDLHGVAKRRGCSSWSEHPRVQDTGLIGELGIEKIRVTETKFEIVAAEAGYLRSLRLLESHFAHCPEMYDEDILPPADRHLLFAGIEAHRTAAERLLSSMEHCWEEDVFLDNLCSVLRRHATSATARVAAQACQNQMLVSPTLKRLMSNRQFSAVLTRLEASSSCGGFTLLSFLTLPLRRLGRLKLLLDKIGSLMGKIQGMNIEERAACENARDAVSRLLARGETSSRRAFSDVALQELSHSISFRRVPRLALSAEGRALVYQGTWRVLARREDGRGPMRAKSPYPDLEAYLLSDIMLLATIDTRGSGMMAVDYCSRSELHFRSTGPGCEEPLPGFLASDEAAKHSLYVSYCNHAGKLTEMIVWCGGAASRARWLTVTNAETMLVPPSPAIAKSQNQLALRKVLRPHEPQLFDEARLATGDVLAVLRNPGDGWLLGRSLVDGSRGWSPSELSVQISAGRKSVSFLLDPRFSIA